MKIQFLASDESYADTFDPPVPAIDLIPDWYKRQHPYVDNDRSVSEKGMYSSTVKHCMPVFDAMSAGYVFCLPSDLHVRVNTFADGVHTSWPVDRRLIQSHSPEQVSEMTIDTDIWNPAILKLLSEWTIVTPPGYSTLFTPPLWREETRFQAFTGIVDTDKYPQPINFPFLVRKDFVGVIENNTPFIQLIPFKRDEWEFEVGINTPENNKSWARATRDTIHRYKRNFRTIKQWDRRES